MKTSKSGFRQMYAFLRLLVNYFGLLFWSLVLCFSVFHDLDAIVLFYMVPASIIISIRSSFNDIGNKDTLLFYMIYFSSKLLILVGICFLLFPQFWNSSAFVLSLGVLIHQVKYLIKREESDKVPTVQAETKIEETSDKTDDNNSIFRAKIILNAGPLTPDTVPLVENDLRDSSRSENYSFISQDDGAYPVAHVIEGQKSNTDENIFMVKKDFHSRNLDVSCKCIPEKLNEEGKIATLLVQELQKDFFLEDKCEIKDSLPMKEIEKQIDNTSDSSNDCLVKQTLSQPSEDLVPLRSESVQANIESKRMELLKKLKEHVRTYSCKRTVLNNINPLGENEINEKYNGLVEQFYGKNAETVSEMYDKDIKVPRLLQNQKFHCNRLKYVINDGVNSNLMINEHATEKNGISHIEESTNYLWENNLNKSLANVASNCKHAHLTFNNIQDICKADESHTLDAPERCLDSEVLYNKSKTLDLKINNLADINESTDVVENETKTDSTTKAFGETGLTTVSNVENAVNKIDLSFIYAVGFQAA